MIEWKPHRLITLSVQSSNLPPAHACSIRNPVMLKAKSSDMNVHTNVDFAQKAGLQARTLNGLCVLCLCAAEICACFANCHSTRMMREVACTFVAPVFLAYEEVQLVIAGTHVDHPDGRTEFHCSVSLPGSAMDVLRAVRLVFGPLGSHL